MLNDFEYSEEARLFHAIAPRVLGSKLDLVVIGLAKESAEEFWKLFCDDCEAVENILNADNPESEIAQFNAGKKLSHSPVSPELYEAIELCEDYRLRTSGLFDVAKGKMNCVDLSEEDESLSLYGATIDFGSFAKGWLMKKLEHRMRGAGVESAFVNYGNSGFLAVGNNPGGEPWRVSLRNPYSHMPLEEIELSDSACCLSCNAPGCIGRVYDPATGRGVETRKMVVTIARDVLDAKILATALMVADKAKIETLKEYFPETKLYIYNI